MTAPALREGGDRDVQEDIAVVQVGDPRVDELERAGWRLFHTSWAARLQSPDRERLRGLMARAEAAGYRIGEIAPAEDAALVALEAANRADYPGGPATARARLDFGEIVAARATGVRYFGGWAGPELVAVTAIRQEDTAAETDFTSVVAGHRRRGLATAVKAASVLALLDVGVEGFGTGGADENGGSLAANRALGYRITERWRTYRRP